MAITSSRTTVRQLESLIRLSEAYARLKCDLNITVEHVRRAYHLLDKSIMRMDMADVELDDVNFFGFWIFQRFVVVVVVSGFQCRF